MVESPLPFEEWVSGIFGQPESKRFFDVWFETHTDRVDEEVTLEHLIQLFREPERLAEFALTQVGRGLWALAGDFEGGFGAARSSDVPMELRERFVDSIPNLYRNLLELLGDPVLAAGSSAHSDVNSAAYMLWDIAPFCPGISNAFPHEVGLPELDRRLIGVLGRLLLEVKNPACQESILHGLGHGAYGETKPLVQEAIGRYLALPHLQSALRNYAIDALENNIL